jgi:hypothetical protein
MEAAVNRRGRGVLSSVGGRYPPVIPLHRYRPWDFLYQQKSSFYNRVIYFIVLFIADLYDYLKDFRQIINIVHV